MHPELTMLLTGCDEISKARQKFHFFIDDKQALILWFNGGRLFQAQLPINHARSLLTSLEVAGYKTEQLN